MPDPVSHLIVTPCPTGKVGTKGYVSVVLSPRLRVDGTLTDYSMFRNWAHRVANLQFRVFNVNNMVTVGGGPNPPPLPVTVVSPAVDPDVWDAVFGDATGEWNKVTVEAARFVDRTSTSFVTAQASAIASTTQSLYAALAKLGKNAPTKSNVQTSGAAALGAPLTSANTYLAPIGNGLTPTDQSYEFHAILRVLAAHPYLMRQLGLVFDLEIDLTNAPANLSEIQIRTNWPSFGTNEADFRDRRQVPLRMQIDANFEPLPASTVYRTGRWLALSNTAKYSVMQGSTTTTGQTLATLESMVAQVPSGSSVVGVPAEADGGLSVAHNEVVQLLETNLERQRDLEDDTDKWINNLPGGSAPPQVFAEDATAGTRWDVQDTGKGVYRSLHDRTAPNGYVFPRDGSLDVDPPDDEGWSSLAISTDGTFVPASRPNSVMFDDVVPKVEVNDVTQWRVSAEQMVWTGWSLSVPKPGKPLDGAGAVTTPDPNTPRPDDPAQVIVDYRFIPGTQERLRFNHTYKFRGRCVDAAGNSLARSASAPNSAVSPTITYGRKVPVPPPTVVRRRSRPDPGVGDMPDVLVIKSELLQSNASTPTTDRMFFVPSITQDRLERHGLPAADGIDVADYTFLADRDARTLAEQLLVDPETGELVAGSSVVGTAVEPGPYRQVALYLPDPVADKIAFHGLPRGGSSPKTMAVGSWPDPESVVLELKAGSGSPSTSTANRRITVQLPKGSVVECEVSCTIASAYQDHMKWYQVLSSSEKSSIRTAMRNGQVHVFSPRRKLTLVHAVRVPLLAPKFGTFTTVRDEAGQTTVVLDGTMTLHRATSERLVLRATWTQPVDDVIEETGSGVVTDRQVSPSGSATSELVDGLRFDLGDTLRHTVTVDAEAYCRFSPYFTERVESSATQGSPILLNALGLVRASVVVTNAGSGVRYQLGTDYTVNATAGTVTPKNGGGITNGTNVRIEFIPLPVSRTSAQATSGKTLVFTVPSSAAPRPPEIEHIIPAFSRTVTATSSKITVTHDGRVLRVVMKRPWFSSGEGELLGVAVDRPAVVTPVLTRWGRDPLTAKVGATVRPTKDSFPKATVKTANVDGLFDVAGHTAVLDAARNVMTADVQVNATFGYRPFVQLHLCRYQPESVDGQHLSPVVVGETLRLGAARVVTVTNKTGPNVEVKLVGPDNVNVVKVTLQEADATITDPDLRWVDAAAPVTLTRTGTTTVATHKATIPVPQTGNLRRLVIEDAEPVSREVGGVLVASTDVAYREVVELPANW